MTTRSVWSLTLSSAALIVLVAICDSNLRADEKAAAKITYDDHARPIFREHCLSCHNQNDPKSDLALDSYAATMEGGAGGEVIVAGVLEDSRLYDLITHNDTPAMPPEQDKLPQAKLDLIRAWIEGGALENSGSTAKVVKKSAIQMSATDETGRPEGPAAMPENVLRQPVVYTPRASAVTAVATSPWAPLAAVAGQRQIVLYHTDTGQLLGVLPFLDGIAQVLRFSRDGSLLIAGGGQGAHRGVVAVFDVRTGRRLVTVGDELDEVLAADINSAHTEIALGGPQLLIKIYATVDGSLVREIKHHTDWVTAIAYSPDGKYLATADRGGGAVVWEADTAREHLRLAGHKQAVTELAWQRNSAALAASGEDGNVRVWEMKEGKQIKNWTAHGGGTLSVHITGDGRFATAGRDRIIKTWAADGKHLADVASCDDIALVALFTHDGQRVIGGDWTGRVMSWNAESKKPLVALPPNPPTLEMRVAELIARADEAARIARDGAAAAETARQSVAQLNANSEVIAKASTVAAAAAERAKTELAAATEHSQQQAAAVAAVESRWSDARRLTSVMAMARFANASESHSRSDLFLRASEQAVEALGREVEQARAVAAQSQQALSEKQTSLASTTTLAEQALAATEQHASALAAAQQALAEKVAAEKAAHDALAVAKTAAAQALADKQAFDAAAERLAANIEAATLHGQATAAAHQQAEQSRQQATARAEAAAAKLAPIEAEFQRLQELKAEADQQLAESSNQADLSAASASQAAAAVQQAVDDQQHFAAAQAFRKKAAAK